MNAYNIFIKKIAPGVLLVSVGLIAGWLLFHNPRAEHAAEGAEVHQHTEGENETWTCSMHPQIKMDEPGQCPLCGMDLIPLVKSTSEIDDQAIVISESAMKLAEIQTSVVTRGTLSREIMLYGRIEPDERLVESQPAHVAGRIEELLVNFTGEQVKKGQLIARIYSPEVITAQKELLEAASLEDKYPELARAAREKLLNWKFTAGQVSAIETSGEIISMVDIFANTSGIVTSRKVNNGDYINKGSLLYEVADLSKVWAVFDAYESDLPWITRGQKVIFETKALPGSSFEGKVTFVDPVMDPAKRIARVRVEVANPGMKLKPEMFVNGMLTSSVNDDGDNVTVPRSAVMWTGKRSIVYVRLQGTEQPTFKLREVTTGASAGDSFIIIDGLVEGEEIVTNGTFTVDASAQLEGKPSMMNESERTHDAGMVEMDHFSFEVSGLCEMCKERIETAAKTVDGVRTADWDMGSRMLKIAADKGTASMEAIQQVIAAAGHDTGNFRAPDEVYNSLPECCLYRN